MTEGRRRIPVHGGECVVDRSTAELRLRQSPLRHMHGLGFVATAVLLGTAAWALVTDWQYVAEGQVVEWWLVGALGLWLPAITYGGVAWRRLRGYSGARRIPTEAVESARLTTESVRWYWKRRRSVPLLVVTYRVDGSRRNRRVLLDPRFDDADVTDLLSALEAAGIGVDVQASVDDALEHAELDGRVGPEDADAPGRPRERETAR